MCRLISSAFRTVCKINWLFGAFFVVGLEITLFNLLLISVVLDFVLYSCLIVLSIHPRSD